MDNEVLVSHLPPHGKGDLRRWHVKIELLQGSLHVFVPQAIDEWIQGGSEDRVGDSSQAPSQWGVAPGGLHVGGAAGAIKQEHSGQVRRAGREGLPAAGHRADPSHRGQDANIGQDSEDKAAHDDAATNHKSNSLMGIHAGTGQVQECGDVTEEVFNHIGATERQGKGVGCVEGREKEPTDPGYHQQGGADPGAHGCPVHQGPVDGQTTIISHGGDEKTLCRSKANKGKELGCTCREGNLPGARHAGHQGPGQGGGYRADVHHGKVFEEKVHRRVQAGVKGHGGHNGDIPQNGSKVNEKEGSSAEQLYLRVS